MDPPSTVKTDAIQNVCFVTVCEPLNLEATRSTGISYGKWKCSREEGILEGILEDVLAHDVDEITPTSFDLKHRRNQEFETQHLKVLPPTSEDEHSTSKYDS